MMTSPEDAEIAKVELEIAARIRDGHRFLITSHRNPDGDALGSSLALQGILRRMGKEATVIVRDRFSSQLHKLPGSSDVVVSSRLPDDYPEGFDALFTMECPDYDRTGLRVLPGPVINIDHHPGNTMYGELNLLDLAAPSVGEMVYRLNRHLGVPLDKDIATAMYVSLSTDTGFFRYSNTSHRAFQAAEAFVRAGADPGEISIWMNESSSAAAIRLLGLCLSSMQFHDDGRIATIDLPRRFFHETGATAEDSEGIVNYGRMVDSVLVCAMVKEGEDGCRISLRAKPGVDVQAVAAVFGGGGHKAASGCFVPLPLEQAKQQILDLLKDAVNRRS